MAEVRFIKTPTGLVPETDSDKEVYNRWGLGVVIKGKFTQTRNSKYHRRFFGLLKLAFDYYEPSNGVLTKDEKRLAKKIFETLDNSSDNSGVMLDWGREFLRAESELRRSQIENIQKAFEPFRKDMTVEAGFYYEVTTPLGIKKVPKSISFSKMDDQEFRELYKSMFNCLWRFVLSRHFESKEQADLAVDLMLAYA